MKRGLRIINVSSPSTGPVTSAYEGLADRGVLIVAAAGNDRTEAPSYPASFDAVLSVGATDARDARADFSNYGAYVDVAAPGANILSTLPENNYGQLSGTSMAAPHVAGAIALMEEAAKGRLTPAQAYAAITRTAKPLPGYAAGGK